jgi:6-phosphogluconolactonase
MMQRILQSVSWSRRKFIRSLGYSSLLGASNLSSEYLLSCDILENVTWQKYRFAYVSSMSQGIMVFAVEKESWKLIETIVSEKPSALALHPDRNTLFAANAIDTYQTLPTGSVESYRIDPQHGGLTLLNRQPLSLSATAPRHLAVSPDGLYLIVAVHGGGAYNILPINSDGSLDNVSGILKEIGSGPNREHQDTAHPQRIMFDTAGRHLLSSDLGNDKLSIFSLAEGTISPTQRITAEPGSGPQSLAIHPLGHLVYAVNQLDASLLCFRYDAANGKIIGLLEHESISATRTPKHVGTSAIAIHPSGDFLYTPYFRPGINRPVDTSIAVWRIHTPGGNLEHIQTFESMGHSSIVNLTAEQHHLLLLCHEKDGVFRCEIDPVTGQLCHMMPIAAVPSPSNLVMS